MSSFQLLVNEKEFSYLDNSPVTWIMEWATISILFPTTLGAFHWYNTLF